MRQRGRKSLAELATVVIDAGRCIPLSPPSELTDAQATVWRDVVGSLPNDWFTRETLSWCRSIQATQR
jgi:hypothetical protein